MTEGGYTGASERRAGRVGRVAVALVLVSSVAYAGPETTSDAMLTFHERLRSARDSLVFADVASFRAWAGSLAGTGAPPSAFPEAQRSHAKRVRALAKQGGAVRNLGEASATLGQLAGQCGGCHASAERGPEFPPEPRAPEGPDLEDHMERHRWALDRLWEGLTAGYEQAWQAGAGQLQEPALMLEQLPKAARTPTVEGLAREMHQLGQRAAKVKQPAQRAKLVGEIVEACGRCHAASGIRGL